MAGHESGAAGSFPALGGRYVLLKPVGAGSSGWVYEGFDPELDRKVAIKLLRDDLITESTRARERLIAEAKTLARVSHPNVVAVHDVGTYDRGRFGLAGDGHGTEGVFVVMELVEGTELREVMGSPHGWRRAVTLLLPVARGLVAAHAAGVVHKDVKPANILLDRGGRAVIVDFGLARGTRGDEKGGSGTPAYMAPEQHAGKAADARSDQYAFCLTLVETVTGERPFQGGDRELVEAKREGLPASIRGMPRWLAEVVARGLDPDPARRHDSMRALQTALEQGLERTRRRWLGGGIAVLAVVIAAASYAVSSTHPRGGLCAPVGEELAGVWDDGVRAGMERAFLESGPFGPELWRNVSRTIDGYAGALNDRRRQICRGPLDPTAERALLCLEGRRAALAQTTRLLSLADAAIVTRAPEILTRLQPIAACDGTGPLESAHLDAQSRQEMLLAEADLARAEAMVAAADYAAAKQLVYEVEERLAGMPPHSLHARATVIRGRLESIAADPAAESTLYHALARAERVGDTHTALRAQIRLLLVLRDNGRLEAATRIAEQAQARFEYGRLGPESAARLTHVRGLLAASKGEYGSAIELLSRAVREFAAVHGPNHMAVANAKLELSDIHARTGDFQTAEAVARDALETATRATGSRHPTHAFAQIWLALLLVEQAKLDEVVPLVESARETLEATLGQDHPASVATWNALAGVADGLGRRQEALNAGEQALRVSRERLGEDHPSTGWASNNLCYRLASHARYEEALPHCRRAVEILRPLLGEGHAMFATPLNNTGEALYGLGRHAEALELLQQALTIRERALTAGHPHLGYSYFNLGRTKLAMGNHDEGLVLLSQAIDNWSQTYGAKHPRLAGPHRAMGAAYRDLEQGQLAVEHLEQAVTLLRDSDGPAPDLARARFELARALWATQPERSRRLAAEADVALRAGGADPDLLETVGRWRQSHAD